MQLYVTDTLSIASFLADFYALSASASLEYVIRSNIPAYSMYSSNADNAYKSAKN
jgi:hypothetical protein